MNDEDKRKLKVLDTTQIKKEIGAEVWKAIREEIVVEATEESEDDMAKRIEKRVTGAADKIAETIAKRVISTLQKDLS